MKRSQIIVIVLLVIMLFVTLFNSFISSIFSRYSICLFVFLFGIISYFLLGFERNKSRFSKDVILSLIIYIIIYYISIYLLGLFIGFNRSVYSLDFTSIILNVMLSIISIILVEILRYIINSKIRSNYLLLGLSLLVFTMIDVTNTLKAVNYSDFYSVLKVVGLFVLPSLSKNLLCSYLSCKVGFKPCIVYRVFMDSFKYVLPIVVNFGSYIESIVYITLPIVIFIILFNKFSKIDNKNKIKISKSKGNKFVYYIGIIFIVIMVIFTSGYFKYQAVVIATGSMSPYINKGDVVIVEKLSDDDIKKLGIGDILVYNRDGKIIVHRIDRVFNSSDSVFFRTKGDNNNDSDAYLIEVDEVIGVCKKRIRYIGYPTVMLYEKMNS